MEGTFAPLEQVLAADRDDTLTVELREILNFEAMAELAFSWPVERRLTVGMLSELQRTLVAGTPGELADAGQLRDRVVMIGAPGAGADAARFIPPPPGDQLRAGVEALLGWMNAPPELPQVVRAAMTHYRFETLHPFSDGNGRLGRLLVIVQLLRGAVIREPLLVVSPWFERHRAAYQDGLLRLSANGDWDAWVSVFAEGVEASATESVSKVERLAALQLELRAEVQQAGRRGTAEQLAADLVGMPFVDRAMVKRRYDLSGQGAAKVIHALADLGLLRETAQTRRGGRVFVAERVLNVLLS